ncbi:enoyl-CoA hydratase/isomerase family protein [Thalassococcus lentus]|uniref:Enoyl-CoA hydratase/isomerase family protein n=1 Tax=Thalassococcus lentus TaxID=1210524 RepID=A0ABT4XT60_9RHOB|nr:enoyl-CoA hydratase/isomerase family protein [Thalassococcus lentus]MDA7425139.1 enoyl-CoA hydratase/isomerase family protein [Thalassococcus lentus]
MIELNKDGGFWTVTLNRPDKANSLTEAMLRELAEIAEAAADPANEARVLVLTGVGKVFSAGADLDAAKAGLAVSPLWERLSGALAKMDAMTICALNGTVAGGAMGMFLACDLRLSVPGAKIFYPVMKLGFLPQPSDPGRLAAICGASRAKMILMAGQKIPVEQASEWGLIDVIADGDIIETARDLSGDVLGATPEHATAIKNLIGGRSA